MTITIKVTQEIINDVGRDPMTSPVEAAINKHLKRGYSVNDICGEFQVYRGQTRVHFGHIPEAAKQHTADHACGYPLEPIDFEIDIPARFLNDRSR